MKPDLPEVTEEMLSLFARDAESARAQSRPLAMGACEVLALVAEVRRLQSGEAAWRAAAGWAVLVFGVKVETKNNKAIFMDQWRRVF